MYRRVLILVPTVLCCYRYYNLHTTPSFEIHDNLFLRQRRAHISSLNALSTIVDDKNKVTSYIQGLNRTIIIGELLGNDITQTQYLWWTLNPYSRKSPILDYDLKILREIQEEFPQLRNIIKNAHPNCETYPTLCEVVKCSNH